MERTLPIPVETNHRKYLFGDFDGDGVKNIDDPYPFDKKRKNVPSIKTNPKHYHQAQILDEKVKFSEVILKVEAENNKYSKSVKDFIKEGKGRTGRVKTVVSTMNKLHKRFHRPATKQFVQDILDGKEKPYLTDIAGVRLITKNRAIATRESKKIPKKYKTDKSGFDNYYANPKNDVYYAFHHSLIVERTASKKKKDKELKPMKRTIDRRIELQVKSRPMFNLSEKTHGLYKKDVDMKPYIKEGKRLYKLGF